MDVTRRPRPVRSVDGGTLRQTLKDQLPAPVWKRLLEAGRLAERMQSSAYVVGGFVRDLLLGRPNLDLDLVIEGDGIAFASAWAQTDKVAVTAHPRFGTATLTFANGVKLDVASARSETYAQPAALPTVARSGIKDDLFRRDFTINTLAIRLDPARFGELVDLYGGEHDLRNGSIRVLHPGSFRDDPTRAFRAVRFEQRFGFRIEKETLRLIKEALKQRVFDRLSPARLHNELMAGLAEEHPRKILVRLVGLGLLRVIHQDLGRLQRSSRKLESVLKAVEATLAWYAVTSLTRREVDEKGTPRVVNTALVYMAALLESLSPLAVREALKRLQFDGREAAVLSLTHANAGRVIETLRRQPNKPSAAYRVLAGLPDELLLFLLAKAPGTGIKRKITSYLKDYRHVRTRVSGDDLKRMGLKPGPQFKKLLDRLLAARLDGKVKSEGDERRLVKKLIGKPVYIPQPPKWRDLRT